jgi:hypothetical protein
MKVSLAAQLTDEAGWPGQAMLSRPGPASDRPTAQPAPVGPEGSHDPTALSARAHGLKHMRGHGGSLHLAQQSSAHTCYRPKRGGQRWRGAVRIVRTLVSEQSWTGFPSRGDHAIAARRSKGTSAHVKHMWRGGGCTWRRAQRRTVPAHLHMHKRQGTRLSGWGLLVRCSARASRCNDGSAA